LVKLIQGNSLDKLRELGSESIDCCITSPPYFGLRDYKVDGQLGLEPTSQEYITKLVEVFDQVKRTLKRPGSCWVVIGDSYGGGKGEPGNRSDFKTGEPSIEQGWYQRKAIKGMNKSLLMIPERFAIHMVDHGWLLRNKIVWHKPNCMPSSAKDRFTIDWEHVYFFTKSQKYFFETQYEPFETVDINKGPKFGGNRALEYGPKTYSGKKWKPNRNGRIKRCVWTIPTGQFKQAHFAVFPIRLIEPMVKAGSPIDGTVLDPFCGTSTVGLVALKNARKYIGIDLNPDYLKLSKERLETFLSQQTLTSFL
jgi:DNA modification methylase